MHRPLGTVVDVKITEITPPPAPVPPTYTVELSEEETVRLAAISFYNEPCGVGISNFYEACPYVIKAKARGRNQFGTATK